MLRPEPQPHPPGNRPNGLNPFKPPHPPQPQAPQPHQLRWSKKCWLARNRVTSAGLFPETAARAEIPAAAWTGSWNPDQCLAVTPAEVAVVPVVGRGLVTSGRADDPSGF